MQERTRLSDEDVAVIAAAFPELPSDYFTYLRNVGWGEAPSGRMVYSAPVLPQDVFGDALSGSPLLLLGDDTQGYAFGYDPATGSFGEFSPEGTWQPWPSSATFGDYVSF